MSRYQVGRDGRTAHVLHAGQPYRGRLNVGNECTSCRCVLEVHQKQNWIPSGMMERSFIGIRDRSDEMLIVTSSGVDKTRSARRRPEL